MLSVQKFWTGLTGLRSGVCGVVGGMMAIELLAGTMRPKFRDLLGWSVLFITVVL